jgi:hypothetical protein
MDKALAEAPVYPGVYDAVVEYVNTDKVRDAARAYFGYLLMIGIDKATLQKDPYWKYMEE